MRDSQEASLLLKMHARKNNLDQLLEESYGEFKLIDRQRTDFLLDMKKKFESGISQLNSNQLALILEKISVSGFSEDLVRSRLEYYEVKKDFFSEIVSFFKKQAFSFIPIDVSELDSDFRGIQVASRDDFNQLINQGYTGDWVITPESIKHMRVQVASMNETGRFPRGYYLNADITEILPVAYGDQTRYRIHIANPEVIDTGNRNVKFNVNPVRYIK